MPRSLGSRTLLNFAWLAPRSLRGDFVGIAFSVPYVPYCYYVWGLRSVLWVLERGSDVSEDKLTDSCFKTPSLFTISNGKCA